MTLLSSNSGGILIPCASADRILGFERLLEGIPWGKKVGPYCIKNTGSSWLPVYSYGVSIYVLGNLLV